VSATAAPLFKLRGEQPATAAVFDDMDVPAGEDAATFIATYAAANNIALWSSERARLAALKATTPAGPLKNTINNIGVYWKYMQAKMYEVIGNSSVRLLRSASDNPLPSSNRLRSSDRASEPRQRRSSSVSRRRSSGYRTSSHRRLLRRSSSRRSSGRSSSRRSSGRRSSRRRSSNSDPRKPARKPDSDPKATV